MSAHLTDLKQTTHPHWNALPSQAIQEELKRIHLAYDSFFKKLGGRPHIKKRHKFKSITYPGEAGWSLKNNRITLTFRKWNPKTRKWQFDKVPYTFHKHRQWHGTISTITIKRDACGDYWLYITTTYTDLKPLPTTGESVGADNVIQGMDLVYSQTKSGMKDAYLTLNTGEKIQSPQFLKQSLTELRKLNKALSRKGLEGLITGGVLSVNLRGCIGILPTNGLIGTINLPRTCAEGLIQLSPRRSTLTA